MASEHPGQLGVRRHPGLLEEEAALWVQPAGQQGGRHAQGGGAQAGRVLGQGHRVEVDHAEDPVERKFAKVSKTPK